MTHLGCQADLLIVGAFFFLGMPYGRTLFKRGLRLSASDLSRQARLLVWLGVGFVLTNMVFLPIKQYPASAWFLPVPVEYYGVEVVWAADLAVISFLFGTVTAVALSERHFLGWILPMAAAMVLGAVIYTYHAAHRTTPLELRSARVAPDGTILQTNGSTCAAAACANIATALGVPKTEKDMVALFGTGDEGASNAEVIFGMRALGFHCAKRYVRDRDASRVHAPAMLLVDLVGQSDGHAVAYMGQKDGKAEIWDPTGGKRWLTPEELRALWRGRAIEVRR